MIEGPATPAPGAPDLKVVSLRSGTPKASKADVDVLDRQDIISKRLLQADAIVHILRMALAPGCPTIPSNAVVDDVLWGVSDLLAEVRRLHDRT